MTATELSETLKVIADKAKVLRDAGVVGRVDVVGVVSFELGEPIVGASSGQQDAPPVNPIDDPDTYGGHIPTRRTFSPPAATESDDDDD